MEKKKYIVYYNDEINEPTDVFSADTIAECKDWIEKQLKGLTPVDDEHPCTDDIMYSSKTFFYQVYDKSIVETNGSEYAYNWTYNDAVYSTAYFYAN